MGSLKWVTARGAPRPGSWMISLMTPLMYPCLSEKSIALRAGLPFLCFVCDTKIDPAVTNCHLLGLSDHLINELIIDGLLNKEPSSSDAVLSLVEENAAKSVLYCLLHVTISKEDKRGFSTKLEGNLLQV